jgi:hypothetical protein
MATQFKMFFAYFGLFKQFQAMKNVEKGRKNGYLWTLIHSLGPRWPKNEKIEENEIILASQRKNSDPIKLALKFIHC